MALENFTNEEKILQRLATDTRPLEEKQNQYISFLQELYEKE